MTQKFRDEIFAKYKVKKVLHGDLHHDNILSDSDSVLSSIWAVEDNMNPAFWLDLATKMKAQQFSFS